VSANFDAGTDGDHRVARTDRTEGDKVLLLGCTECGGNYFSAASAGICPDCGADLEPGSPARLPLVDLNGNGRHSPGEGVGPSEFHRLWQSLLGEELLRTETP